MTTEKPKISLTKKIIALGVLTIIQVALLCLKTNVQISEFFSRTFGRFWIFLMGNLFSIFPFSLYEILLVLTVCALIFVVVRIILQLTKKRFKSCFALILSVFIVVLSLTNLYTATASMAYNRQPLFVDTYSHQQAKQNGTQIEKTEVVGIVNSVNSKLNSIVTQLNTYENGCVQFPFDFNELNDMIEQEYQRINDEYLSSYTPKVKKIANKTIMSELHVAGVFFALTGEANVNPNSENHFDFPFVVAHEVAHSKGVMREYDANSLAFYLLITSDNVYLQYSALARYYSEIVSMKNYYQIETSALVSLSDQARNLLNSDYKHYNESWAKYTFLHDLGDFFNNLYLTLNGQNGLDSYEKPPIVDSDVVPDENGDETIYYEVVSFSNIQNIVINLFLNNNLLN